MHAEARRFLEGIFSVLPRPDRVLELGSRNVNGSARELLPGVRWHGVDLVQGPGVDEVADARTYRPNFDPDLVICTEVLEHEPQWSQLVANAARIGGWLVLTCAGPGRKPHSGIDGEELRPGEWYQNIPPDGLRDLLRRFYRDSIVIQNGPDLYAVAR